MEIVQLRVRRSGWRFVLAFVTFNEKGTLNQATAYPAPAKGLPRTAPSQRPLRDAGVRCLPLGIQEPVIRLRLAVSDKAVPDARASFKLSSMAVKRPH